MNRRAFLGTLAGGVVAVPRAAETQPPGRVYRVGVVLEGGPYLAMIDGLRLGLKELGFEERQRYVLLIRNVNGDLGAVAGAAKSLVEQDHVDVIYATANSVTLAVQQGTTKVPIIFNVGSDPVRTGFIKSFANPGGRLTGVHTRSVDLVAKRLQILKEAVPKIRRGLCFYEPDNPGARTSLAEARGAASELGITVVERQIRSVSDLRASLQQLKGGETDAIFQVLDAMVNSQAALVADTALAKRLPTMFNERNAVTAGGLLSYSVDFYTVGRLTARYVHRVLLGASPATLPVEGFDKLELTVNLKTANAIGVTIAPSVLLRADQVIG